MRNKVRKMAFLLFGSACVLYVFFSRYLYRCLAASIQDCPLLPPPYNEDFVIQPCYLWGVLLVGVIAFWLFLILINRQVNWREYRQLILIAGLGFLLEAMRISGPIHYPEREHNGRLYALYLAAGAAAILIPLLLRFLAEKIRKKKNRSGGNA